MQYNGDLTSEQFVLPRALTMDALIHEDGSAFTGEQIQAIIDQLTPMTTGERCAFRDWNSSQIATSPVDKLLVVSGPGSGKSFLFDERIAWWGSTGDDAVLVTTFARKLAADLESRLLRTANGLSEDRNANVKPCTLHALARSILEQAFPWNGFNSNVHMLTEEWDKLVWLDANGFSDHDASWSRFDSDRCQCVPCSSGTREQEVETYEAMCHYYNAVSFNGMTQFATQLLRERPSLASFGYVVADELQDFNALERRFLEVMTANAKGFLLAGDDDQVLYDKMKWSTKDLIVDLYHDNGVAKAMLPFSGRSSAHIVSAATSFMERSPSADEQRVAKVLLPIETEDPFKVRIVVCAQKQGAQEFIATYVQQRSDQLIARQRELTDPNTRITDPSLLLLTPDNACPCLGGRGEGREFVMRTLAPYRAMSTSLPEEYYVVRDCQSWLGKPDDNWLCRKVLRHTRRADDQEVADAIRSAVASHQGLNRSACACVSEARQTCEAIETMLESDDPPHSKAVAISQLVRLRDIASVEHMIDAGVLAARSLSQTAAVATDEYGDDPDRLQAAECLSIYKSKGLSADEVVILGFDQRGMQGLSDCALYVAMTRARRQLTMLTVLGEGGNGLPQQAARIPDADVQFLKYTKQAGLEQFGSRDDCLEYVSRLNCQRARFGKKLH